MNLLLDTHTFLWFILGDPQLSARAKDLIEDTRNEKWLSVASVWEMAIKVSVGKLTLHQPFDILLTDQLQRNGIELLPITLPHLFQVATLPFPHRDPFDRLLIAQSLVEKMPCVSADAVFDNYGVTRLW
jgi:PIN domain nuclease of toxin-antitoxin system